MPRQEIAITVKWRHIIGDQGVKNTSLKRGDIEAVGFGWSRQWYEKVWYSIARKLMVTCVSAGLFIKRDRLKKYKSAAFEGNPPDFQQAVALNLSVLRERLRGHK